MTVRLTVICGARGYGDDRWGCGAVLGSYENSINEKWPFWCENCQTTGIGDKYPWEIIGEVVSDDSEDLG